MSYFYTLSEFSFVYELCREMMRKREQQRQEQLESTMTPDDLLRVVSKRGNFYDTWKKNLDGKNSKLVSDDNKFVVILDVLHFKPEEITVKTANGYVVVEGKHEDKNDLHGSVSRQFVRRYALPEDVMVENIRSKISSDGVLTITAPRNSTVRGETNIPIEVSSEPANLPCRTTDEPMSSIEEKKEDSKESKESQKDIPVKTSSK